MKKLNVLCLWLLCLSSYIEVNGQKSVKVMAEDTAQVEDAKANPTNLAKARFQINDVKTRGIIVRLKTNQERIAAYRKEGYKKVADKLEERSKATNLLLEYAFITYWTYSPVYFMESQNTSILIKKDSLVAKTFDLKRDTSIYMNHDSFYIVDYGDLMVNDEDETHPLKYSKASNNPIPGNFLVVKDYTQAQLQPPMPYYTKMWLEEWSATDKIVPIENPLGLNDSVLFYLSHSATINDLRKSAIKTNIENYLDAVYDHITIEQKKINIEPVTRIPIDTTKQPSPTAVYRTTTPQSIKGSPYQNGVKRLNQYFIKYYCKRLDKDRNILCNNDPYYWWQRNPNIRYLPYLRELEIALKSVLDSDAKHTK